MGFTVRKILTLTPDEILETGKGPEPHCNPIFLIGTVNGVEVTATLSRKNAMEKVGGWHIALGTTPEMSWEQAAIQGISAEHLGVVWRAVEENALQALLPHVSVQRLLCQTKHNTAGTAQRSDLHAHVLIATPEVWANNDTLQITHPIEPGKPRVPK